MIKYRALDGRACESLAATLQYDVNYIKRKNVVMQDGYYSLYKINSMSELVPLLYGRYKMVTLTDFPYYIIENKSTQELTLITISDLDAAIKMLISKRR